jgi:hypothetical protein
MGRIASKSEGGQMRDWLNGVRVVVEDELEHFGHAKLLLEQEQKERQEIVIRRLRELWAPYTYYCEVGEHSWRWESPDGVQPPGKDGESIVCPEHGCTLCL